MPPIGRLLGKMDFSNLFLNLSDQPIASLAEAKQAGVPVIKYGLFINTVLDFLIIAFAVFLVVKQVNKLKRQEEAAPPPPSTKECPMCTSAIPIKAKRCPMCTSEITAA